MTTNDTRRLRGRLRAIGLSAAAIDAVWPRWWSEAAAASPSARVELVFSLARRFGFDPRSLLNEADTPRFLWRGDARFKHLSRETELERATLTSFGRSVAVPLLAAAPDPAIDIRGSEAGELRGALLSSRPYVELADLLLLAWSAGIPSVHLRVFPLRQKRMAAMTVGVGDRPAILLGKDSQYPAPIAFYVAHELAHVALGHVAGDRLIVDLDDLGQLSEEDQEEQAADRFALELLTGRAQPTVLSAGGIQPSARSLAEVALAAGPDLGIEPGMLAQCYGFSTRDWAVATKSLRYIYSAREAMWSSINALARLQLDLGALSSDAAEYLDEVLGSKGQPGT